MFSDSNITKYKFKVPYTPNIPIDFKGTTHQVRNCTCISLPNTENEVKYPRDTINILGVFPKKQHNTTIRQLILSI